ncbi:hypothetical protein HK104_010039 [Borealophlyctis nickersoniae]|nr:hypothetical protein HK104_010039 [Borealophlyctis nickersoniae]
MAEDGPMMAAGRTAVTHHSFIVVENATTYPPSLTNMSVAAWEHLNQAILIGYCLNVVGVYALSLAFNYMKTLVVNKLEIALVQAQQGALAKSQFHSQVSHEMRTPLAAVLGWTELVVKDERIPDETKKMLQMVLSSGKTLRQIIDDTLDFSKLAAGKMRLSEEVLDLFDLGKETAIMEKGVMLSKGLELLFDYPIGLPILAIGDPVRIRQIILNLLSNAIKFTKEGCIRVEFSGSQPRKAIVHQEDGREEECDVVDFSCAVVDTGIGISAEDQRRLFREFEQVDNSSTRSFGGSGLGLAISRRLLDLMSGSITVHSDPTKKPGTTFKFTIPLRLAPDPNPQLVAPTPEDLGGIAFHVYSRNPETKAFITSIITDRWKAPSFHNLLTLSPTRLNGPEGTAMVESPHNIIVIDTTDTSQRGNDATDLDSSSSICAIISEHAESFIASSITLLKANGRPLPFLILVAHFHLELPQRALAALKAICPVAVLGKPVAERELWSVVQTYQKRVRRGEVGPGSVVVGSLPGSQIRKSSAEGTKLGKAATKVEKKVQDANRGKVRLLVAEDDPINRKLISRQLQTLGYTQCAIAVDGQECVEMFEKGTFDIVLTDLQMPKLDGLGVARRIRAIEASRSLVKRIPILALTADVSISEQVLVAAGMQGVVTKPVSLRSLEQLLGLWAGKEADAIPEESAVATSTDSEEGAADLGEGVASPKTRRRTRGNREGTSRGTEEEVAGAGTRRRSTRRTEGAR